MKKEVPIWEKTTLTLEEAAAYSGKLNVSIDSLLLNGGDDATPVHGNGSGTLRIISPNESVILRTSKVMRSQPFKGGKSSLKKYALFASDGNDMSFWSASNIFLRGTEIWKTL